MTLVYTGIDEAGYGPMLGPLCVASVTLRVEGWSPGDPAPDLWTRLQGAVCRTKREARDRIAVGDSKDLKLPNTVKTKHPLHHLERGVLAFLSAGGQGEPTTDEELFSCLGACLDDRAWYGGGAIGMPQGVSPQMLAIDAKGLRSCMRRAGVELLGVRVRVVPESEFNALYSRHRTKAAATGVALRELLDEARSHGAGAAHARIVCDRQGGRTRYGRLLEGVFGRVEVEEESARASRYTCDGGTGVLLTPGADGAYFPVALASMAAKLVRELAMARFNRYWSARVPRLRPTAGYVQDARRWLSDTRAVVTEEERAMMVRLA